MKDVSGIATGRSASLFREDIREAEGALREAIAGRRILAVGAAGSIGSNTVHVMARYAPAALHIVDQNENALTELVRQLRSQPAPLDVPDFQTLPLDYGAAATERLLAELGPYDRILNFAAIKHVRTEKDPFGILQMLDTNIVKQARFRDWIARHSPQADYFSVSTDKAANPVSFMGATKRVMEHVLFAGARAAGLTGRVNTARFANVAFSNGSLLQGFEHRLARGEPLACPRDIRRFFVSLEESGEICTLASVLAPHAHIAIPRLDPAVNLVELTRIAEAFLRHHGLEPEFFEDEREACQRVAQCRARGRWPLILTPPDTAGEKPYEEFVGVGETTAEIGLRELLAVPWTGIAPGVAFDDILAELSDLVTGVNRSPMTKDTLKALIGRIEPAFLERHIESARNLDQRA
jgi:FlaA1/EpsC-like NDP-sugar epimerase